MEPGELNRFLVQESVCDSILRKNKYNTNRSPRVNLNRELKKCLAGIDNNLKSKVIERRLLYEMAQYEKTEFPMSDIIFHKKYDWLMARPINAEFGKEQDMKWRHASTKWKFLYQMLPVIEKIFIDHPHLKSFLCGDDNENFEFDQSYVELRTEFMIYHALQIIRAEKTSNIEFQSYFTLIENGIEYALSNKDGRLPLRDPYRV